MCCYVRLIYLKVFYIYSYHTIYRLETERFSYIFCYRWVWNYNLDRHTDRQDRDKNWTEDMSKWKTVQCLFMSFWILFPLLCERVASFFFLHISFLLIYRDDECILYSEIAALVEWCFVQRHVNIFICLIALWGNSFNSGEQKDGSIVWESFTHLSSARTPQPFIAVMAPNLCNWTWDIRMGGADARCMLKIVLSHWTPS